jgi:hypothetical protein
LPHNIELLGKLEKFAANKARATDVVLTASDLATLDSLFPQKGAVAGARHEYDRSKELNI